MKPAKYFLYIFAILLLSSTTYAIDINDPDLIAYYPLTDNADEATGNWVNATNSGVTFNGTHADFGAGDYLEIGNLQSAGNAYTVALRINQDTLPSSSSNYPVSKYDPPNDYPYLIQTATSSSPDEYLCAIRYSSTGASATSSTIPITGREDTVMCVRNGTTMKIYVNGVLEDTTTGITSGVVTSTINARIGDDTFGATSSFDGTARDFIFVDRALTDSEALNFYNNGVNDVGNFTITATDSYTTNSITNFSAIISNTTYSTTNGTIITDILVNSTSLYNITISSNESGGYYNQTYNNYNVSSNLAAELDKLYRLYNVSFSNFSTLNSTNFTRNLTYSINYTCPSTYGANIITYVNGSIQSTVNATCDNSTAITTGSYQHSTEGLYNISFTLNGTYRNTENTYSTNNYSFFQDLNSPTATISVSIPEGFEDKTVNVTLTCTDTAYNNLTYNITYNGTNLFLGNLTSGTNQTNSTEALTGTNTAVGVCSDPFSSDTATFTDTIYAANLALIDEQENAPFDVTNISRARVYYDDNSSFYEFTGSTNTVNFTSVNQAKLRFELVYSDGSIVTRYVDVTLQDDDIRVCANKEGVTHYEQLIVAATEKPVVMNNVFSNCLIAADYTRFAYQDALLLKAYSINTLYYLYTFDSDNQQTILASVDGSIATFINLDTIEFAEQGYNINVIGDGLSFKKASNSTIEIYYDNTREDNQNVTVTIKRLDTSATVFTSNSVDPNEFTILFDFSTLAGVNETTLFQITLDKQDTEGNVETIRRYFNTGASVGVIPAGLATAVAILLTLFGLTLTTARSTFSWFGMVVMIGSIGILSFAISTWYVTFLMAINLIIALYIAIILVQQTYPTVA